MQVHWGMHYKMLPVHHNRGLLLRTVTVWEPNDAPAGVFIHHIPKSGSVSVFDNAMTSSTAVEYRVVRVGLVQFVHLQNRTMC